MISLPDDLPLVRLVGGDCHAYEDVWLKRSLSIAAKKAGYAQWWLAEHVTASITEYLRTHNDTTVIDSGKLQHAVECVLQAIGYGEVARHFVVGRPPARISLIEIAREACSGGYELEFFPLLGKQIIEAVSGQPPCCELVGLEYCVKLLRARRTWSRTCDELREEIVTFVREQTCAAAPRDLTLSFA